jgi:hypothetical protein
MKLGAATVITDEGIRPDALTKALEERGFDSLMVVNIHTSPPVGPRRSQRAASATRVLRPIRRADSGRPRDIQTLLIGPGAFIMLSTKPESDTLRLLDNIAALTETYI